MGSGRGRDRGRSGPSSLALPGERDTPLTETPKSTIGRPRLLTGRQVAIVLAEHARFLAWKALRKTVKSQRDLAREFSVSQGTINWVVRSGGQYKQAAPEHRAAEAKRRRDRMAWLRARELL